MTLFESQGKQTLTIVLDRTLSMKHVIEAMKKHLAGYIIRRLVLGDDPITQLGLVTFDDHYEWDHGEPAYHSYGLTDNLEEFMYWLHTVEIGHGADSPEAIACALQAAVDLDPDASIWVVTDSVPHGWSIYSDDNFPDGCPCGIEMPPGPFSVLLTCHDPADVWTDQGHRVVLVHDMNTQLSEPEPEEAAA